MPSFQQNERGVRRPSEAAAARSVSLHGPCCVPRTMTNQLAETGARTGGGGVSRWAIARSAARSRSTSASEKALVDSSGSSGSPWTVMMDWQALQRTLTVRPRTFSSAML